MVEDKFKIFSLNDWLNYILIRHQACQGNNIERLRPIANCYDLLNFDCPIIVITGTNGKGSCIKFLENIYRASGYHVGTYMSPHCFKFNERILIDGFPVSDNEIIDAFAHIDVVLKEMNLKYFEFITLAALYIFKKRSLDILLLEVGVGGRLDPVNLIDADLTILTTIGLDHIEMLGNDRAAIANEKIALFRKNRLAVCGELAPPPNIFQYANELKTTLYWIHRDFEYAYNLSKGLWHWQMNAIEYHDLPIPEIKLQNAATALAGATALNYLLPINKKAIVEGLKNTKLTGRFEIIEPPYRCILDVAHNLQATEWLVKQLNQLNIKGKILAVFATLTGKDVLSIIQCMKPLVTAWYICPLLGLTRDSAHEEIIRMLKAEGVKKYTFLPSATKAFYCAKKLATKEDCVLVFGSFHLISAIKKIYSK